MKSLIGKEYNEIEKTIQWELFYENIFLVIVELEDSRKLLGIGNKDLKVKWEIGGNGNDAIMNIWIKNGYVYAGTWGCWALRLDYKTGKILDKKFTK